MLESKVSPKGLLILDLFMIDIKCEAVRPVSALFNQNSSIVVWLLNWQCFDISRYQTSVEACEFFFTVRKVSLILRVQKFKKAALNFENTFETFRCLKP